MSKTAFIFPGQGAQYVGMGKDFYDTFDVAKTLYQKANDVLGFDLMSVSFNGPEESLKQTRVTQPAIYVHSLVALEVAKQVKGASFPQFHMTAGHSLGEYPALVAAGFLSFEDALRVVKIRAEGMQKAGEEQKGTMAAVMGLETDVLNGICAEASSKGIVQCANFNSPGQIVISGSVAGVQAAMALAKEQGARMVKELVVSGAFHSPLMEPAKKAVAAILDQTTIHDGTVPVYANVTAQATTKGADVKKQLVDQITSAVRWQESAVNMIASGVTKFYEFGPGNVLQGLIKRIDKNIVCECIGKPDDLNKI